jgi:hypothetical protein
MSTFSGFNALLPGTYSMVRQFAADTGGAFVAQDFRGADWFGACPQLNAGLKTAAMARGEVRAITVTVTSGTFDQAEEADPNAAPGGNRFVRAASGTAVTTFTRRYINAVGLHEVWWRIAAADGQIEVWFDIPAANQV